MKRIISFLLFIFSLGMTVAAGLAWFNNICIVRLWYLDLTSPEWSLTVASGKTYSGPIPALDWSAVDFSTVSTFIPFFGFLMITLGFLRIIRGQKGFSEDFPFFCAYDRISVSLGLIGTLWGIIIIGYYPIESIKMSVLMMCLHTALFSTLIAVAWVFIVVLMIVKPFMQWWSLIVAGEQPGAVGEDLISVLESLKVAAAGSGQALSHNHEALKLFNQELTTVKTGFSTISDELGSSVATINEAVNKTLKEATEIGKERAVQAEQLGKLAGVIDHINSTHSNIVTRLEALEAENSELKGRNRDLLVEQSVLEVQAAKAKKAQKKAQATLAQIKEALN
jgi:hypothetical protein